MKVSAITMMIQGWCDDCDQDVAECYNLGYCIAENNIDQEDNNERDRQDGSI